MPARCVVPQCLGCCVCAGCTLAGARPAKLAAGDRSAFKPYTCVLPHCSLCPSPLLAPPGGHAVRHHHPVHDCLVCLRPQVVQGAGEQLGRGAGTRCHRRAANGLLQQSVPCAAPPTCKHTLPSDLLHSPHPCTLKVRNVDVGNKTETLAEAAMRGEPEQPVFIGNPSTPACRQLCRFSSRPPQGT